MDPGEGCAGDGPGDSPAITPAPPPAASPAPEPSAERAPAAGPGGGSGSPSVSGPPAGACPASEAGSEAGALLAPVHGDAQSVPGNSDAPRTRSIVQGSPAPQTPELGTEKASDVWETQATYTGRRPGVSLPERSTFIPEQEEALCPDQPLSVKKTTQEDVKVMTAVPEEREWDLDTAARIDQSLVKQNGVLMEENSKLEAMLGSAREEILHLRHQVSLRDDLLQLYSDSDDDEEEDEEREEEEEEEEEEQEQHDHPYEAPRLTLLTKPELPHRCPHLEALQEQLRLLEEENGQLREEVSQLDVLEEEMLILECVEQFAEASQQMAELSEVLVLRMENYDQQQEEVTQLRTQVTSLQQRCQSYGAETEKLQQQLASEKEIQMQLQDELQDLREKYMECGGVLIEDQENPLHQRGPASTGSAAHSAHSAPPEELPDCQESPAKERRRSVRRIVLDPLYIMEGCELYCSEDQEQEQEQEQDQGFEAEEGSMPAEEFTLVELLVPEEDLGAIEEVVPPEDRVTDHAELVLEEAEAWEEVGLELDEAAPRNVVTSDLEASSLGLSHLDIKHVLQQLANWQDTHYRQKTPQKGECSHGASLQPDGQAADRQADERLPNPAAEAAGGQNKHGGQDHGVAALGADQGLSKAEAGQGQPPSHGPEGSGAFCGKGLHQQGQSDKSPGVCCFPAACRGPTDSLKPLLLLPNQVPPASPVLPTLQNGTPICHQPTPCPDEPEPEVEGPSHDAPPRHAEGPPGLLLQPVRRLWLLVPDRKAASKRKVAPDVKVAPGQEQPKGRPTSYQTEV
ncbi:huntingtin-associated protein 1 isoform X1 [Sturnira hondurensis]|uniref:huntingtin-associated protein 1 isoform X1 n=2 Tax=Sturnira hondurensis TaxID=192404 RepID=UPI00187B02CC|nr:huntingtin-associated protein 1 isoform X1 [Sturnira hondurensis]